MANAKITDAGIPALAEAPNDTDLLYLVDVSDTTDDATGTSKKITAANLKSGLVAGTLVTTVGATGSDTNVPSEQAVREAIAAIPGGGDMTADGTTPFTGVVSYNATKTFTSDLQIVSKDYVDGAITAAGGYTDENAQDAVGGAMTDSDTIDFTYNDTNGTITGIVKDGSITLAKQANLAANTIIGRVTASTGVPEALTAANVRTIINVADGATANAKISGSTLDSLSDDTGFVTAKAIQDGKNVPHVAPGTNGNLMQSNGTDWTSVAVPTWNQNTTGSAATLTTARNINGVSFNGSADITIGDLITTAAPSADTTASGVKISLMAGETLVFGEVCYIKSDGKAWKADANGTTTYPGLFMALASISADASGSFLALGIARNDAWNWTVGGMLYLSTTAGAITQTAPSTATEQVQILGMATHADRAWFSPQLVLLERA